MKFYNREETQSHLKICIDLCRYLILKYKVIPHREWYLFLDNEDIIRGIPVPYITKRQKDRKEKYRNPDIIWWDNGLWVLEVDGYVHHIKSGKTETRNKVYENNNVKFIAIETFHMVNGRVKSRSIEDIKKELDLRIANEQH